MLKNDILFAKFGVDKAENELLRVRIRVRQNIGWHKQRTGEEALKTQCDAAAGVKGGEKSVSKVAERIQSTSIDASDEAATGLARMGTNTAFQIQCTILELEIDCPEVEKGYTVEGFDNCAGKADDVCVESNTQQWACEMRNLVTSNDPSLQNKAYNMIISSQLDEVSMKQDQLREDVMNQFDELNDNLNQKQQELLANLTASQAMNTEKTLAVLEKNRLRLQQQQGKMMESIQCNTELQYEKMLVSLEEGFTDMKKFVVEQAQEITEAIGRRIDVIGGQVEKVQKKLGALQGQLEAKMLKNHNSSPQKVN